MISKALALAVVLLAVVLPIAAASVEICAEPQKGRPIPPPCIPPATYTAPGAKPPFDALTRLGRSGRAGGQPTFTWIKAGPSSRPCTTAEAANGPAYKFGCAAKIGDELYVLPQFRELTPVQFMAESAAVGTPIPAIRRVDDLDVFAEISGERFCRAGSTAAACVGKRRFYFVAIQNADQMRANGERLDADRFPAFRGTGYWPKWNAVNSWMVCPVPDDAVSVRFAVNGGRLLTPVVRIRDLQAISAGGLK